MKYNKIRVGKHLTLLLLLIFIFLFSASYALAARSIFISSGKSALSLDEEMLITASASGFTNGEKIYLKGAFYKDGVSNYFGFTKYNDSWIKNSAAIKTQKEIVIGSWDNTVLVKLDYEDTGYIGIGDYKFKLGFYYLTSSGNTSSVNWSTNSLDIIIKNEPSPTSEPESQSDDSGNEYEEEVDYSPTPKLNQDRSVTKEQAKSVKSAKISNTNREASSYAKIKPITKSENIEDKKVQVLGAKKKTFSPIFLFFGLLILCTAIIMVIKNELKERNIL